MQRLLIACLVALALAACNEQKEHTAAAIHDRDSVAMMTTYGVNTLISDSGVIKYRIVAERWEVNTVKNHPRWSFIKGLFLEQFDEKFHVQSYIQCDTGYFYNEKKLWELRGRVSILTKDGLRFNSEELFWDQNTHELYSNCFSRLVTPERNLQGAYFRSDEKMTKYFVSNTKGSFERGDFSNDRDSVADAPDTVKQNIRPRITPRQKLSL
jgi:LPS export ABC transporter protein LptC